MLVEASRSLESKHSTSTVTQRLTQHQEMSLENELIELLTQHSKLPMERVERARTDFQKKLVKEKDRSEIKREEKSERKEETKPLTFYQFLLEEFGEILCDQLIESLSTSLFSFSSNFKGDKDLKYHCSSSMELNIVNRYAFHFCQKNPIEAAQLLASIINNSLKRFSAPLPEDDIRLRPEKVSLLLIQNGADLATAHHEGALNKVVLCNNLKLAKAMLEKNKIDLDSVPKNTWANPAAHAVGCYEPDYRMMELLREHKADFRHRLVLCNAEIRFTKLAEFRSKMIGLSSNMLKFLIDCGANEIDLLRSTRYFNELFKYINDRDEQRYDYEAFQMMQNNLYEAFQRNESQLTPQPIVISLLKPEVDAIQIDMKAQDSPRILKNKLDTFETQIKSSAQLPAETMKNLIGKIGTARVFLVMHMHFQEMRFMKAFHEHNPPPLPQSRERDSDRMERKRCVVM